MITKINNILYKLRYRIKIGKRDYYGTAQREAAAQLNSLFEAQHLKDQEDFAKEKELMFNPDWKPDIKAILKEHNEAVAQIKAEHEQKVKEIFEAIEREFGYFSDSGLEKIIIDDGGYYGNPGSLEKYQALKGGK